MAADTGVVLSVGIFLTVLAVVFLAYCITGSVVRYRGGIRTFPQMIPHYTAWRSFGNGARDFAIYVTSCGKRRAPPTAHQQVEYEDRAFNSHVIDEDDIELDDDAVNQPAIPV
jgi:hypothetical protein